MKSIKFGILSAFLGLGIISCTEDIKEDPAVAAEEKASLHVHIDHMFNNDIFALDQNFTLTSGEVVKFSTAQFYVGNFRLMDDDQNITSFADSYILATPSVNHTTIGEMDAKHYHMVMLNVGVDSATNKDFQPIDFADGNPLAPQLNNMWWSWNAGYIFFKLEGQVDRDADGTFDDNFEYHIGTNANILNLQKTMHSTVEAGEEVEVEMLVDYAQFFNGLNLSSELQGHMGPVSVVSKLKANAALAFTLK